LEREAWRRNSESPFTNCRSIPANVLKNHHVHEPLDPRFRSAARLLQALWREERGLPIGSHPGEDSRRRKLGSRISQAAGKGGGNFLTPEIAHTARREAAYREIGALIDAERLATNLLSSMPLTFNLLAPWGRAVERASSYLIELSPGSRARSFSNTRLGGAIRNSPHLARFARTEGRRGFVPEPFIRRGRKCEVSVPGWAHAYSRSI
jgi:PD-(D/E)XK nuclease superfamily protein